jgi:hypothetical protein
VFFDVCKQQNWVVAKVLERDEINLTIKGNLNTLERLEWEEIDLNYKWTIYHRFSIQILYLPSNRCENGRIVVNQIVLKDKDISTTDITIQDSNN